MSSVKTGFHGSYAVDGHLNTNAYNGCYHSDQTANDPWLTVVFGEMKHVMGVDILNRGDGYGKCFSVIRFINISIVLVYMYKLLAIIDIMKMSIYIYHVMSMCYNVASYLYLNTSYYLVIVQY